MFTIPENEYENVMSSFWTMMKELETQAHNNNDVILKHLVEGYFRQWNRICDSDCRPRWDKS